MSIDLASLCFGFATFTIFLIVFLITLRFLTAQQILVMIKRIFILGLGVDACLVLNASFILERSVSLNEQIILAFVTVLIYGLSAFVFVLCFFGPNETSIRMRLIDIIGRKKIGVSREEIAQYYNNQSMLDVRLKRLIGAGDIKEVDRSYRLLKQGNAFFIIDRCAVLLKKIYQIED